MSEQEIEKQARRMMEHGGAWDMEQAREFVRELAAIQVRIAEREMAARPALLEALEATLPTLAYGERNGGIPEMSCFSLAKDIRAAIALVRGEK